MKSRAPMYIGTGSILCFKSFIDGWYFRDLESDIKMEVLDDFNHWIQARYELNDTRNWDRIILFYSQDENDALTQFFRLFDIFLEEYGYNP